LEYFGPLPYDLQVHGRRVGAAGLPLVDRACAGAAGGGGEVGGAIYIRACGPRAGARVSRPQPLSADARRHRPTAKILPGAPFRHNRHHHRHFVRIEK